MLEETSKWYSWKKLGLVLSTIVLGCTIALAHVSVRKFSLDCNCSIEETPKPKPVCLTSWLYLLFSMYTHIFTRTSTHTHTRGRKLISGECTFLSTCLASQNRCIYYTYISIKYLYLNSIMSMAQHQKRYNHNTKRRPYLHQ